MSYTEIASFSLWRTRSPSWRPPTLQREQTIRTVLHCAVYHISTLWTAARTTACMFRLWVLFCRFIYATSTLLGVNQPTAGAVLLAVHDRTEGVPDRWRSYLERSSIWRYVCSVAGRLWTAIEDRTFCRCYNAAWLFFRPTLI